MVKASRRAIFRHVLRGSGFELQHDTANEVLMLINRSLDPEPLTEGMWASYVAIRRDLRFSGEDRARRTGGAAGVIDIPNLADHASFRDLPRHIAKDFMFLLRVEAFLRMWPPSSRIPTAGVADQDLRDRILANLANEIRRYLGDCEETEAFQRVVLDPIMRCLTKAAGMQGPSDR